MQKLFTTSAMALILAAAPAAAQTTAPGSTTGMTSGTGQAGAPMANQAPPGTSSAADMAATPGAQMGSSQPGQPGNTTQTGQDTTSPTTMNQGAMNPGMTGTNQGPLDSTAPVPSDQMGTTQGTMGTTGQGMTNPDTGSTTYTAPGDQAGTTGTMGTTADDGPTSPDGTPAFGIEPYFGIMGGYHNYDRITQSPGVQGPRFDGALVEGLIGVNIPLGPVFVGVEGHGAYGFGDARWEYGVRGRGGFRAGDSGLIYLSAGYMWTDVRSGRGFADRKSWMWGIGLEAGPRDIGLGGITSNSGLRFRVSMETADFDSIRPMAGVVFHF